MRAYIMLLLSVSAVAAARPPSSDPVASLMGAPSFCMGCEAFAGDIISGDEALGIILRRKTAADDLQRVFEHGNLEGQLYALAGLREIDRRRFQEDVARFRPRESSVTVVLTQHPSSVLRRRTAELMRHLYAGTYASVVRVMQKPPRRLRRLPKLENFQDVQRSIRSERNK